MKKYILIHTSLYTSQMRDQKKNHQRKVGFYLQDSESSLARYQFAQNDKWYYVLSWIDSDGKPSSVLSRYKERGNNPKTNKIFTERELFTYLTDNAVNEFEEIIKENP